jgi:hypothetical protein
MKMSDQIHRVEFPTAQGNRLHVFWNATRGLLVVDLVHAVKAGGSELVRLTVDEDSCLECEIEETPNLIEE